MLLGVRLPCHYLGNFSVCVYVHASMHVIHFCTFGSVVALAMVAYWFLCLVLLQTVTQSSVKSSGQRASSLIKGAPIRKIEKQF